MPIVPKIVHYFFVHDPRFKDKPWSLVHYVCIRSAVEHIKPDEVRFYCNKEPGGPWWELTRPYLKLVETPPPQEVFGRPLLHPAHQSDVLRLQKLIEVGGIYLDVDVFVHKSFDALLDFELVLGRQDQTKEMRLGNSVMIAKPNALFLTAWYDEYKTFRGRGRDHYWDEHSIDVPGKLYKTLASHVHVLDQKAFFWPSWDAADKKLLFGRSRAIVHGQFANHLWETKAWDLYLEYLTPGQVRRTDTMFHRWARPYVADLRDSFGAPTLNEKFARYRRLAIKGMRRLLMHSSRSSLRG